jgi:hypothetical protein
MASTDRLKRLLDIAGSQVDGRAVTEYLFVSPDGDNTDGASWEQAYSTLPAALDAASTDADALTLIMLSPHATYFDINRTGDPTWSCNVIIRGSYRNWAKIQNDHGSATSVMKFTGKVSLENITIDCGSGTNDGVIISGSGTKGSQVRNTYFECENVTGPQTALEISGGTEYVRLLEVKVHGVVAQTTGILLDNCSLSNFDRIDIHECATGLQITDVGSDDNIFSFILLHDCTLGLDLDAGNEQFWHEIAFSGCTTNVDDEVGDHVWLQIHGAFPITIEPDNFTGVTVSAHANPDTWGADTEIRAAASSTKPFRIVGVIIEPDAGEKFRLRLTDDSGTTFFDDIQIEGSANVSLRTAVNLPSGTENIFNKGTRISGSVKSESGGNDLTAWLEIQEI